MNLIIASEKVGKIGEPYTPKDGINVDALLAGGFIVEVSTTEAEKPAKTKPKKASKE
jgi:hypothetical protein